MELYPGSLFRNSLQAEIPLDEIDDIEVKTASDSEGGTSWFLTLYLNKTQNLSSSARKWIRAETRFTELAKITDNTLHWGLSWPEGGAKKTERKLKMLTNR